MHFPELFGLAGDHSERPAPDRKRFMSLYVNLKSTEDC